MTPETARAVLEMLEDQDLASRNHNFTRFTGRTQERVLRLFRLFSHLSRELAAAAADKGCSVKAFMEGGELVLEVFNEPMSYRRQCRVPAALASHFIATLAELGLDPPEGLN